MKGTTESYLKQLRLTYYEKMRSLGFENQEILSPVVAWSEAPSDEVSINLLRAMSRAEKFSIPSLTIHTADGTKRTDIGYGQQLQWGDWIPREFENKLANVVQFRVPALLWSKTRNLKTERHVYLSLPWGFAAGNYCPVPNIDPHYRLKYPTLVVAPNSKSNIYHHLIDAVAPIAVASVN